ncbi:hypothetical protein RB653_000670 [Dictyostelium firmibasis]|uniref:Uncharacterized protein n=1 Tax=Dictyostelium firmibasis TaxID=79012 RepID=A0AAN7U687_9MYCE
MLEAYYKLKDCLIGHTKEVTTLATNCKRYLVSGSKDCTVKVWIVDIDGDQPTTLYRTLKGHTNIVQEVAITDDDKYVISGSWDGNVCIWDIESGQCIKTIKHESQIMNVSYILQPDGEFITSLTSDGIIMIYKLFLKKDNLGMGGKDEEEEPPKFYKSCHSKEITISCSTFSKSSNVQPLLCTAGSDGKILSCFKELIKSENTKQSCETKKSSNGNIFSFFKELIKSESTKQSCETTTGSDNEHIIETTCIEKDKMKHWRHESGGTINYIKFSPGNYYFASGCSEGILCLWDIDGTTVLDCGNRTNSISFNPIRFICSTANDNNTILWNIESKTILTTIVIDDFNDINNENKYETISNYKERDSIAYKSQLKEREKDSKPLIRCLSTCWFSGEIFFVACDDNTIREYKVRFDPN